MVRVNLITPKQNKAKEKYKEVVGDIKRTLRRLDIVWIFINLVFPALCAFSIIYGISQSKKMKNIPPVYQINYVEDKNKNLCFAVLYNNGNSTSTIVPIEMCERK